MALNHSHAANGNGVVIFNGERILIFYDGCELSISAETNDLPAFKGDKHGRLYLTSHRVIFVNKKSSDGLQSISMPFLQLRQIELKQPIFGANKIEGKVVAEQGGGFDGVVRFSVAFKRGGAIEFGQAMLEAGRRASQNRQRDWAPPPYVPPPPGYEYYQAPPAAYAPPYQDPYYNFVPYHDTFSQPPPDYVYMMEAPPPYPGAGPAPPYPGPPQQQAPYPQQQSYPTQQAPYYGYPAAPAGPVTHGYYGPQNPNNVYAAGGPAQPSAPVAPPSYTEATKKND